MRQPRAVAPIRRAVLRKRGEAFREYDSDGLNNYPQVLTDNPQDIQDAPHPPPERRGRLVVPLAEVGVSFRRLPVVLSKVVALSLAAGAARSAQPAWAGCEFDPPNAAPPPEKSLGGGAKNNDGLAVILFKTLDKTPPLVASVPPSYSRGGQPQLLLCCV